jgi:hypothetical protein
MMAVMVFAGCDKNKVAVSAAKDVAVNHLELDKTLAEEKCLEDGDDDCKAAEDLGRWISLLGLFDNYFATADKDIVYLEMDKVVALIIEEMVYEEVDPKILMYVSDIKVVLEAIIAEEAEEVEEEVEEIVEEEVEIDIAVEEVEVVE